MRSWITKISLVLAVIIITAHNLAFHDHDLHSFGAPHLSDHEKDHGKHGLFALNLLDHCFTASAADDLGHTLTTLTLAPVPVTICLSEAVCHLVLETSYQLKYEFPPPLQARSSTSFRGPPILSV